MKPALRLWWLLRGTTSDRGTAPIGVAFGLLTWTMLTAAAVGRLAATSGPDAVMLTAMSALLVALALTAVVALHSLLSRSDPRRLEILRVAGASRRQTAAVSLLEAAESAVPGVIVGSLAHVALQHMAGRAGVDLSLTWPTMCVVASALALALVVVVSAKVRLSVRSAVA